VARRTDRPKVQRRQAGEDRFQQADEKLAALNRGRTLEYRRLIGHSSHMGEIVEISGGCIKSKTRPPLSRVGMESGTARGIIEREIHWQRPRPRRRWAA